ncbi:TadE/TadG family type IV pilus assembly protein [Caulobacter sp. FWC2]|uniref:TadE/TadG family type IV pilus assembly protein n=1 Tax=Caulobacter sp. FWC2 TaxID=69664 RepID=UPI000C1615CE|nr:TadE/TadG family type IV pilus assembly protein [Caulobacter sp. FWC2]PIB94224.1 pilus assembly protein TadG [Caulobacter sp. FWC2]
MPTQSRFLRRLTEGFAAFARRLRRDERGAIAVQFALLALPLAVLVFGLVDVSRISLQRRQMQDALDAATLIAARSTAVTDAGLEAVGDPAFLAEVAGMNLGLTASSATFKMGADNHVIGTATATLQPVIANLWNSGNITVTAVSDVVRSSKDLEVSLVLDITGSMSGTRIADLKTAASDLVDIIVKDAQTPFYSKVALVPYAAGVNVGSYADAARGPVPVRSISGAGWLASAQTITGITKANPAVVTVSNHGYATGDKVYISGITGNDASLNGATYTITKVNSNSFSLNGVTTTKNYNSGGGVARKCLTSSCTIVVTTSTAHGFITDDQISFANMGGLTSLNGTTQTITNLTATTFDTRVVGDSNTGAYTSGGAATCQQSTVPGCYRLAYTSASNTAEVRDITNCVSERIGTNAYTDAAPSTSYVGTNYPSDSGDTNSANPCPTPTIMPLSSDKTALKAQIGTLAAGGSTAGQIGLAWGWYMIAPNFSYLWPNASQKPAAYKTKDLMKVVIMMTDGAFNTPYCNGVIASDAGGGSGNSSDHINCNATNGDPFTQARALCTAIKNSANDITLYTVGFDVGSDATAKSFLTSCASDTSKAFFPATGSELKSSFKAIAQEISDLRIAK